MRKMEARHEKTSNGPSHRNGFLNLGFHWKVPTIVSPTTPYPYAVAQMPVTGSTMELATSNRSDVFMG